MKQSAYAILAAGAVLAMASGAATAGSIWARVNSGATTVLSYGDDTARRVGDVLTIVVNERSTVDNQTDRKLDKTSDRSIKAAGTADLKDVARLYGRAGHTKFNFPTIDASSQASSKFEGKLDYQNDRTLTDRITVTVHDVLPNGNLVVLGCRRRSVDGETQVIGVSGIARPSDITFANTINSEQVAEFHMVTLIQGPDNQFTKPGWLGRILNFISPW